MRDRFILAIVATLTVAYPTYATEPNETFATRTVLSPGVLSVADELTVSNLPNPDTVLASLGFFGQIEFIDDDSSRLGDGHASELQVINVNPGGTIDFLISGFDDFDFIGNHSESGNYEVFVDVFDFFGDYVETLSEVRLLQPGSVDSFSYEGSFEWLDGTYDVYIDNTAGAASDVDFFTFTGLTPGAAYVAQTQDPDVSGIDTYLGWFNSSGTLLAAHDDIDPENGNLLSLLEGTVPANGMLTFAVTGFGDDGFVGDHDETGTYALALDIGLPGDFNSDNKVDAADYVVWRKTINTPAKYAEWRAHFGESAPGSGSATSQAAVPEPASIATCLAAFALLSLVRRYG